MSGSGNMRKSYAWFIGTVAVAVAFALWLLVFGNQLPGFVQSQYKVAAALPNASSLTPGARVTMAGIPVGTVKSVERRGMGALVQMGLTDKRVTPLPKDSVVRVRLHTAIGETYVEIVRGHDRQTLDSGQMLPVNQSDSLIDVDTILSVLQGPTRVHARQVIATLGRTLDGAGAQHLNDLLAGTTGTIDNAARLTDVVYRQKTSVSRLIDELGRVMSSVGERDAAIRQLGQQGLGALQAVGRRDASVRAILRELPATLRSAARTSATLEDVTGRAAPVLTDLGTALKEIRPAVQSLQPAAQQGRAVVQQLGAAAPRLKQTLDGVKKIAGPAAQTLPQVRRAFCEVNPLVRYLKPYTDDVLATLVGLSSSTNGYDALGHVVRLTPTISDNTLAGLPDAASKAAFTLIHAGLLSNVAGLTYNPYPKPGHVGRDTAPHKGGVIGPEAFGKTDYVYPRVLADC